MASKDYSRKETSSGSDKRYVRRDSSTGRFKEVDTAGRSLSQDIKSRAKSSVVSGNYKSSNDKKRRKY